MTTAITSEHTLQKRAQKEMEEMQKELQQLRKENIALEEKNKEQKQELSVLQHACCDLSTEKIKITRALQSCAEEVTELRATVQELQKTNEAQQKDLRQLNPVRMRKIRNTLEKTRLSLRKTQNRLTAAENRLEEERKSKAATQFRASKVKKAAVKAKEEEDVLR